MKRILALLTAISCVFVTFASCTKSNQKSENSSSKYDIENSYDELIGSDTIEELSSEDNSYRELTDSELEILNFYDNLEYKSNDYLSDNELTEFEKESLNDTLDELIEALKNQHINGMASVIGVLSDDSATDTMTSFAALFFQALEEEKQILTSYWDKIYNKEKIIDSHKEKYQKSLDYLKTLSTPVADNSATDDSDYSLEDSSDVTTTYTAKSKMPFKKGEMVDVWGKATREKGTNNFLIDADSGWTVDCSNVGDFTKLELTIDGENVTFTGKVIGEYTIKFQKVKYGKKSYSLKDFKKATLGEKNALDKANDYLEYSAFSKKRLIEQLEYEKFTHDEAVYAVEHCGADWNEQAEKKAQSYMEYSSFSRNRLIEQLEYEGFTHKQAIQGAKSVGY